MKVISRAYDPKGDDFQKCCRILLNENKRMQEYFTWQLGRLMDWKYGLWQSQKTLPSFFSENAQLWVNQADEVLGFVISENSDSSFSVFECESDPKLYSEMIQWVITYWGAREGRLETELNTAQIRQQQCLDQLGFQSQESSEITQVYALKNRHGKPPLLAAGLRLVDMAETFDPVGKATLQIKAFSNRDDLSELDLQTRAYVRKSPIYNPRFDLSIVNASGEHLAGCEAFIDVVNGVAEIERVCTHPKARRQGLARAVIEHCFYRLRDHGIETAYITGWNEATNTLYHSLGAVKQVKRIHYELISKS
jgi:GNAT superfamily N-acetyltransferase